MVARNRNAVFIESAGSVLEAEGLSRDAWRGIEIDLDRLRENPDLDPERALRFRKVPLKWSTERKVQFIKEHPEPQRKRQGIFVSVHAYLEHPERWSELERFARQEPPTDAHKRRQWQESRARVRWAAAMAAAAARALETSDATERELLGMCIERFSTLLNFPNTLADSPHKAAS
jgi:hypothetical protein